MGPKTLAVSSATTTLKKETSIKIDEKSTQFFGGFMVRNWLMTVLAVVAACGASSATAQTPPTAEEAVGNAARPFDGGTRLGNTQDSQRDPVVVLANLAQQRKETTNPTAQTSTKMDEQNIPSPNTKQPVDQCEKMRDMLPMALLTCSQAAKGAEKWHELQDSHFASYLRNHPLACVATIPFACGMVSRDKSFKETCHRVRDEIREYRESPAIKSFVRLDWMDRVIDPINPFVVKRDKPAQTGQ